MKNENDRLADLQPSYSQDRKVTETLCGTSFSASMVSSLSKNLDTEIETWRNRQIEGEWHTSSSMLYMKRSDTTAK